MRLVQLNHIEYGRRIAIVDEPKLVLLKTARSVYELALSAVNSRMSIVELANRLRTSESLNYEPIYQCESAWHLLPAFDNPHDPHCCMVSGTGLTHKASADKRENMHHEKLRETLTDSMQMYLWGVEGGRPANGEIGQQPEWFYKGTGHVLRAHGQTLVQPSFAYDGGEEPELAGAYIIDENHTPWRIGFAIGNEFSDHELEKKNYLYLAHSKLRQCAIGPELSITNWYDDIQGRVVVHRGTKEVWSHEIQSGRQHMSHSLANLEHHHFKYAEHCLPRQAHVHFFGASAFSFGSLVKLQHGDCMEISWEGLGRPLRNRLVKADSPQMRTEVKSLVG